MKEGLAEAEVLKRQECHLDGEHVGAVAYERGDERDGCVFQHFLVALLLHEPRAKVLLRGAHAATGQLAAGWCLQSTGTLLCMHGWRTHVAVQAACAATGQ